MVDSREAGRERDGSPKIVYSQNPGQNKSSILFPKGINEPQLAVRTQGDEQHVGVRIEESNPMKSTSQPKVSRVTVPKNPIVQKRNLR